MFFIFDSKTKRYLSSITLNAKDCTSYYIFGWCISSISALAFTLDELEPLYEILDADGFDCLQLVLIELGGCNG